MTAQSTTEQDVTYHDLAAAGQAAQQVIDDFARVGTAAWGIEANAMLRPLRAAIENGQIEGRVAVCGGQPVGLIVFQAREDRGRIGFVHTIGERDEVIARLEEQAVAALRAAGARRIAHEVPLAGSEAPVQAALLALGFQVIPRLIMSATPGPGAVPPALPAGYTLRPWDDEYMEQVAGVLHEANRGTLDALLYPAFQSLDGAAAMLRSMVGDGSGPFDPGSSGLILYQEQLVGCLISSRQPPGQGFIDEVSIVPAHQGRGLGRVLMLRALAVAHEQRLPLVRLGVTEANAAALALYKKLGFAVEQRLTAYVWQAD